MIGIFIFTGICLIALGAVIGIYIASQVEDHIDKRIKK